MASTDYQNDPNVAVMDKIYGYDRSKVVGPVYEPKSISFGNDSSTAPEWVDGSVFETGGLTAPEDKALFDKMDIYATTAFTPTAPQPEKEGVVGKIVGDVKDVVGAVTGAAKDLEIKKLVKAGINGDDKTEKAILDKMKEATDGAVSQIADLKKSVISDILKTTGIGGDKVASLTQMILKGQNIRQEGINALVSKFPKIEVLYNTATMISNADFNTTKGITDILNAVSGNDALAQVLDMGSAFKVMGKVATLLPKIERADAMLDKLMAKIKGTKNKKLFAISISRDAFMSGNLEMINRMLDYSGVDAVMLKVPDAVQLILMNYRLPPGVKQPTMAHYTLMVNTLTRLDVHWFQYNRNGTWIPNLAPFTYASRDTERVLGQTTDYRMQLAIAKKFPSRNLPGLGKVYFPLAAY
jgi:hypothetical protein